MDRLLQTGAGLPIQGSNTVIAGLSTMASTEVAMAAPGRRLPISSALCIGCGIVLMLGGGFIQSLEPGPAVVTESPDAAASRATAIRLQKAREREDQARAEQERLAADAAAERARREIVTADSVSESRARAERDEAARRQAAIDEARRSATESEEAWKRFYKPSANCRDPSAASVECVNEYVKAKREFSSRPTADASR